MSAACAVTAMEWICPLYSWLDHFGPWIILVTIVLVIGLAALAGELQRRRRLYQ